MSSKPVHGEVYSIQRYVIVCQWLATGQWFSPGTCTPISSNNKTDHHDITEILLKVTLNTIYLPTSSVYCDIWQAFQYSFYIFWTRGPFEVLPSLWIQPLYLLRFSFSNFYLFLRSHVGGPQHHLWFFISFGNSIMFSYWLKFIISSSQKPHVWWNCYIVAL